MGTDTTLTATLTGTSFTFIESMGIRMISLQLVSGTVTYHGAKSIANLSSNSLILSAGVFPNIVSQQAINGFVVDATSGVVNILASQ